MIFDWRLELALWLIVTWLITTIAPWPAFLILAGVLIIAALLMWGRRAP